jgi:hypothetical protein
MTPKQRLQVLVDGLPDDVSTARAAREAMELAKYLRSLDDFEHDRTFDHDEVFDEIEAELARNVASYDKVEALLGRYENRAIDIPLSELVAELLRSSPRDVTADQLHYEIGLLDRRGKTTDEESLCRELGMTHEELFGEDSDVEETIQPPLVGGSDLGVPRVDRRH